MPDKTLTIPHDQNFPVKVGDNLYIQVSQECTWCYSDQGGCFPGGLLANGSYSQSAPGTKNGPYLAEKAGSVNFESPVGANQPCNAGHNPRAIMHSITVGS